MQDDRKPGPKPDNLKIDGDWKDAKKKGAQKGAPPPEGWPNPEDMQAKEKGQDVT